MKIDIQNGVLAIIGKTNTRIVCQVTGVNTYDSITRSVNNFGKNCILTRSIETGCHIIIFEYNLRGELRNSTKLLKSLRNKLVKSFDNVERQQLANESWMENMASIHGRGPD
jgi:hypothetical protein